MRREDLSAGTKVSLELTAIVFSGLVIGVIGVILAVSHL
jgi:hypothetical protein